MEGAEYKKGQVLLRSCYAVARVFRASQNRLVPSSIKVCDFYKRRWISYAPMFNIYIFAFVQIASITTKNVY